VAIYFDGDAGANPSRIDYGDLLDFDDSVLTDWSCVVKLKLAEIITDNAGAFSPIIGKQGGVNGWELRGDPSGKTGPDRLSFRMKGAAGIVKVAESGELIDTAGWHTVIISSEQTGVIDQNMYLYLDDMDNAEDTATGAFCDDDGSLIIGNRTALLGIDAHLAHVAIYDKVLSPAERNALLTGDPQAVACANLIFLSSCERGVTTTACRNLVTGVAASSVQTLTMAAERPDDFWPFVVGLRKCSANGSNASQTFFVHSAGQGVTATIDIDTVNTFDSDSGSPLFTSTSGTLDSTTDFCWCPTFSSLALNTTYYYRVQLGGEIVQSPDRTFTTLPDGTAPNSVTFIAGSCTRFEDSGSPYARRDLATLVDALTESPDFWIHLGDVIYADNGFHGDSWINSYNSVRPHSRDFGEQFGFNDPFVAFHEQIPGFYLLDDHEQTQDTDAMWREAVRIGGNDIGQAPKYKWTKSGSGTDEYYCELAGGGDPGFAAKPTSCFIKTADTPYPEPATEAAMGSLAAGDWDWGNNDSLGYNTVYVRLPTGGPDPDDWNRNIFVSANVDSDGRSPEYDNSYDALANWLYLGNPTPVQGAPSTGDGLWYTFDIGPKVTFFALDTRTQRDADNPDELGNGSETPPLYSATGDAAKTLLGSTQETDLLNWIAANSDKLKIILSPSAMHQDSNNANDSWSQRFTDDRTALRTALLTANNLCILSGDQHYNTAAHLRETEGTDPGDNLWEFNAGSLDSNHLGKAGNMTGEFSGGSAIQASNGADGWGYMYMLCTVTYSGPTPSLVVKFMQSDGVLKYTSPTIAYTPPGAPDPHPLAHYRAMPRGMTVLT